MLHCEALQLTPIKYISMYLLPTTVDTSDLLFSQTHKHQPTRNIRRKMKALHDRRHLLCPQNQ